MKVLMLGWEFPPFISGGLGTVCKALTQALTQMGTEIIFLMPKTNGHRTNMHNFQLIGADEVSLDQTINKIYSNLSEKTVKFLEINTILEPYDNVETYKKFLGQRLNRKFSILKDLKSNHNLGKLNFTGGYGKGLLQEVSRYTIIGSMLALQEEFDVIHAHDWMTYPAAVEIKKISKKPLVCHIHATEFDRTGDNPNHAISHIEWYGLEMADRVIAVSQRTKDTLVSKYCIDPKKIFVVHNAVSKDKQVEREHIKRGLKEKIVLFLGRVTVQKGPDYFVEAARLVLNKVKNVRFVMAGTGDMLNRLIERVAYHRLQNNFHFTGFLYGKEVEQMFAMSDIYVMPSVSEPFGITPFEAMLYHVPAIISKQSGIAEIFENAIKLDFWDVEKLANNIIEVLTNEALSREMVVKGGAELDQISWNTAAKKVLDHYNAVTLQ